MERDIIGWSWQDWLPHVIESIEQGDFKIMKTYEVRYKNPRTEEHKKVVLVVEADCAAEAKQQASLQYIGYVSNRLCEMLKATEVREEV